MKRAKRPSLGFFTLREAFKAGRCQGHEKCLLSVLPGLMKRAFVAMSAEAAAEHAGGSADLPLSSPDDIQQ